MYDEIVNCIINGYGKVEDYIFDELKQLDVGSWFNKKYLKYVRVSYKNVKVFILDEILECYGLYVNYYIEIKLFDVYLGMEE